MDTVIVDRGDKYSLKIFKPTIHDYQFQYQYGSKTILDTVLTQDKTWYFTQWNNRDNFARHQFANIGSGFNSLSYTVNTEQDLAVLPANKSFGILGIYDVKYYEVKTPTTTFIYHNAVRNGAALTSTYTQNIGKNFNFAVEYMGLRSQGQYRNSLAANNNTLFSAHYTSPNRRYEAFAHFLHQNVNNQENGGIAEDSLYQSGGSGTNNRSNLQVNLQGSDSRFSARRYYLTQQWAPFNAEKYPFRIRHTISHQSNKYTFQQTQLEPYFYDVESDVIQGFPLDTRKYSKNFSNTVSLVYDREKFKLDAGLRYQNLQAGVSQPVMVNGFSVLENLSESRLGAVGNLSMTLFNKVSLNSFLEFSRGKQFGNYLRSANSFRFEPIAGYFVNAHANFQTAAPSFNYLFNSSVYKKFNYYLSDYKNQSVTEIGGDVNLKWFRSSVFANYFRIDNFTYLNGFSQPQQSSSAVNISQLGGEATFEYRKFRMNSRILFQKTLSNSELFPTPAFVGRTNIYYQSKMFNNAAEIQTGLKVNYFTKFATREYSPVLNDYILPAADSYSVGGKPYLDAYFNLKVKRMFFFIEGQHLNHFIKRNTSYTFPHYPFYDFRLNLGIVWYLIN